MLHRLPRRRPAPRTPRARTMRASRYSPGGCARPAWCHNSGTPRRRISRCPAGTAIRVHRTRPGPRPVTRRSEAGMHSAEDRWLYEEAGAMVRPYALTRGPRRPTGGRLDLIAMLTAVRDVQATEFGLGAEHRAALRICRRP